MNWTTQIQELEQFFSTTTLPSGSIRLSDHEHIADVYKFIVAEMEIVKENNGNDVFKPDLDRLIRLKEVLS